MKILVVFYAAALVSSARLHRSYDIDIDEYPESIASDLIFYSKPKIISESISKPTRFWNAKVPYKYKEGKVIYYSGPSSYYPENVAYLRNNENFAVLQEKYRNKEEYHGPPPPIAFATTNKANKQSDSKVIALAKKKVEPSNRNGKIVENKVEKDSNNIVNQQNQTSSAVETPLQVKVLAREMETSVSSTSPTTSTSEQSLTAESTEMTMASKNINEPTKISLTDPTSTTTVLPLPVVTAKEALILEEKQPEITKKENIILSSSSSLVEQYPPYSEVSTTTNQASVQPVVKETIFVNDVNQKFTLSGLETSKPQEIISQHYNLAPIKLSIPSVPKYPAINYYYPKLSYGPIDLSAAAFDVSRASTPLYINQGINQFGGHLLEKNIEAENHGLYNYGQLHVHKPQQLEIGFGQHLW